MIVKACRFQTEGHAFFMPRIYVRIFILIYTGGD